MFNFGNRFQNKLFRLISLVLIFLFFGTALAAQNLKPSAKSKSQTLANAFGNRKDVQRFIWDVYQKNKELYKQSNMTAWEITKMFKNISSDPKVLQAISRPFEDVPWGKYRERFLGKERVEVGVQFWKKNEADLKQAEKTYGVPAEIIVAILGVETYYGQIKGVYPVLQTLATLAFDYPPRASFFKQELEQFMLLIQEEKLDPIKTMGSYAGAMGIPQFIPSSYRRYAVDFNGTGRKDLIGNMADSIASVANYFKQNGWIPNEAIAYPAQVFGSEYQRLANTNKKDPKPRITLDEFARFNIVPQDKNVLKNKKDSTATYVVLQDLDGNQEHWLTLQNFYVITRYNKSVNYAMAVYQLSKELKARKNKSRN